MILKIRAQSHGSPRVFEICREPFEICAIMPSNMKPELLFALNNNNNNSDRIAAVGRSITG
jgi:hypothetical protein